jgi:hypothetical protein
MDAGAEDAEEEHERGEEEETADLAAALGCLSLLGGVGVARL